MRKFRLFLLSIVGLIAFACTEAPTTDPDGKKLPTISLTEVTTTTSSVTFNIALSDATEAGYVILREDEVADDSFDAIKVLANASKLESAETQDVTISDLDSYAKYAVIAYALNGEMKLLTDIVLSEKLTMETVDASAGPVPTVDIEVKESTTSSISFKLTPQNNPYECCYKVYRKTPDFKEKDASEAIDNAEYLTASAMEEVITINELIDDQVYVVYAVAASSAPAGGYRFELSRAEISTLPLDPPTTDIADQTFTLDSLIVGTVRMYTVELSNENYELSMMLQSDYFFEPHIPAGEYILEQGTPPGEAGYIRDLDISLFDIAAGKEVPLHKGAVTLDYTDGTYTFDGHFITKANELINYTATSDVVYPLYYHNCSALLYPDTNILAQEDGNDYFRLEMHLADGETIESGTYSIANGKLTTDSKIVTTFGGKDTGEIELSALEVTFSPREDDSTTEFKYTGTATTAAGDKIEIIGTPYVNITEKPKPALDTVILTKCRVDSWYFGDYPAGWYSNRYTFSCDAEGYLTFSFEIDTMDGSIEEVPEGEYIYNESAGPMLEIFIKKNGGTVLYFQDEGGVKITKLDSGDYRMEIELYEMGDERAYTAVFEGEINMSFWSGN